MIRAHLNDCKAVESLHPLLGPLFDYVRKHDLRAVPAGRIELCGEDLFINVADVRLVKPEKQKLEVHRAYLDVHIPLDNVETIGWRSLGEIGVPSEKPFDTEHDFALYACPAATYVTVRPGEFFMAWPQDAHAPVIGEGTLRKLIAKVRISAD